jgi:hypothetical protein
MNLKFLFSRLAVSRLDHQARLARRALRDHQRSEMTRIRELEIRARGIRLFTAWSRKPATGTSHTTWQPLGTPTLA